MATTDPTVIIESTDDHFVDYNFEPMINGDVVLRRTVWTKHRQRAKREIVHQEDVARWSGADALEAGKDLVSALYFVRGRVTD